MILLVLLLFTVAAAMENDIVSLFLKSTSTPLSRLSNADSATLFHVVSFRMKMNQRSATPPLLTSRTILRDLTASSCFSKTCTTRTSSSTIFPFSPREDRTRPFILWAERIALSRLFAGSRSCTPAVSEESFTPTLRSLSLLASIPRSSMRWPVSGMRIPNWKCPLSRCPSNPLFRQPSPRSRMHSAF